jgi:diguanylate cyclase (GGDEF)-like protein
MQRLNGFFDRLEPPLALLEPAYRQHYLGADILQTRTFWLLVAMLKAILLAFNLFSTDRNATHYLWVVDDMVVASLLVGVALALGRLTQPARYDQVVALVMLAVVIDNWIFAVTGPPADYGQFSFDLLLILCCYVVVPVPLALRAALAGLATCLSLGVLYLARTPAPVYDVSIPTLLVGTNLLGALISARVYTYRRRQYRFNREVQALNEKLAILAETDALTRVFNRRRFLELGAEEFARHQRYGQTFSIALIDVDLFKQVNDQFGHAVGDDVLRAVAQSVVGGKRTVDQVGRLGGEEFGLLLPQTPLAAAVIVVERIRQRLGAAPIEVQAAQLAVRVTFSAGVSQVEPGDGSIEVALRRADQLLYQAKQAGRNRVEAELNSVGAAPSTSPA